MHAKSSSTKVERTLKKAGAAKPPAPKISAIPKHSSSRAQKPVDYSWEVYPPPAFQVDQPGGSHLKEAPGWPKRVWTAEPRATPAELMTHIRGLARGGRQQGQYRSYDHWLQDRAESLHGRNTSGEVFQCQLQEETYVDESHTGVILSTVHTLLL